MSTSSKERINFGKIKEIIAPPNLIEIQVNSYHEFLQAEVSPAKRQNTGLEAVFNEIFPVESYDEKVVLRYDHYEIGAPKLTWLECIDDGQTYGSPLHVIFQLKDENGTKEERVFMGEIPLITPQGSFVINGAERVIVSQLHRSPGVAFEATKHPNGKTLNSFRIIPDRGSWFEAQFDTSDMLYVYLDRKKRRRKFLITTFLRAINFLEGDDTSSDASLLNTFYDIKEVTTKKAEQMDNLEDNVLISDLVEPTKGIVVARAFEPLSKAVIKRISELGVKKIQIVDVSSDEGLIIRCMAKDPTHNEEGSVKTKHTAKHKLRSKN